jgi:hypothetical protein
MLSILGMPTLFTECEHEIASCVSARARDCAVLHQLLGSSEHGRIAAYPAPRVYVSVLLSLDKHICLQAC